MEGKDLIIKMLNLLVEMAEHCINKDKPKDNIKCEDCALCWNFSLSSNGCFLVETIAHNDKFIEDFRKSIVNRIAMWYTMCKEKYGRCFS